MLTSLGTSFLIFIFLVLVFSWLSRRPGNRVIYFPKSVLKGLDAPKSRNPFAWIVEALQATEDDVIYMAGLDAAIYLRFFTTALMIMVFSAGVCLLLLIPLSVTDTNYRTTMEQAKNKTSATYDDFDKLAMGNIQQESNRLWAFVFAGYWVSIVTYIVLWKTYKHVLRLRAREQTSSEAKLEQFAVLVRDIPPVPTGETRREQVDTFFGTLYPETFERSMIVTDISEGFCRLWT